MSYEEWESIGADLFLVDQAWQWWVGDWINYGEKKYGKTYEQALSLPDSKPIGTLMNIASVSSEFETSRRREVSWSHHASVQCLEPEQQDQILIQAEKEGRPRAWVREQVKKLKGVVLPETLETEVDGSDDCIAAWIKSIRRMEVLKTIVGTLEPYEAAIVRDWVLEKLQ